MSGPFASRNRVHGTPHAAVEELHDGLAQPDIALVLFFCSSDYDRDALAAEMARRFAGVPVVGCTTAGEIGPLGCRDHSIAGVSFAAEVCTAVDRPPRRPAAAFEIPDGVAFAQDLRRRLREPRPGGEAGNSFAFLLVDGLSGTRSSWRTRCSRAWATSRWSAAPPATA